ncbi:hypothetical protein TIFTF001_029839 [Ficus carica]|uniref:Uncharacterized protein n=1 Tax=Ficus carica TaxID=3494 RepID=A0AA88J2X7_FICCA|nr:hypothetical protein TIFTF001_029839 [Ficus carica]
MGRHIEIVGGEMKGILVPKTATYVGLIELVRSVIGICGLDKTIVMRYVVETGMPPVRIQCDVDVKFYIQLEKKDVHVLSKFPITIDVFDESAAEAMPPDVGESNHIDVQPSWEGGQSDEAIQPANDSNLIILPLHIPSPIVGLDLHNEYGIDKQHQVLNHDLCMAHDDCNAGKLNVADATRHSNEKSFAPSPPAWAEMVKRKNLGSDIHIETDSENCFKYFYMYLAASKHANLVYPDPAFGICVQHLAANLKTRYKDFKGHLKTYFDGASRLYLLSEHNHHMESIHSRNTDMYRYLVHGDPTKRSCAYSSGRRYAIMTTNITESLNNMDQKARLIPVGFLVEWLRELL